MTYLFSLFQLAILGRLAAARFLTPAPRSDFRVASASTSSRARRFFGFVGLAPTWAPEDAAGDGGPLRVTCRGDDGPLAIALAASTLLRVQAPRAVVIAGVADVVVVVSAAAAALVMGARDREAVSCNCSSLKSSSLPSVGNTP